MKYDGYKLHQNIILTKTVEKYLEDDFEELIELFLKYLNDEYIEIYNEDSLKFELGTFLRIILPNYHVSFEKNINYFIQDIETVKHEIDITIYPKDNQSNMNNQTELINPKNSYAIELKFPSFKTERKNNKLIKIYNRGGNQILENIEKDMQFVEQLVDNGFKNAWSFVLVPEIANSIYQVPQNYKNDPSKIYYKFRGFDSEGKYLWTTNSNENNPYKIKWNDWKNKETKNIGKYYIKNGKELKKLLKIRSKYKQEQ